MQAPPPSDEEPNAEPQPRKQPSGRWCPTIDAAVIDAVARGEMSLQQPPRVLSEPLEKTETLPMATTPEGYGVAKQPHRRHFDAEAIYRLAQAPHPWQSPPIKPLPKKSEATDSQAEQQLGVAAAG
ncbi:MAG: hypothetical protein AAGJ46_12280 [Planctomycetota bacterium]